MNTGNLRIGLVVKNYATMCELLGEEKKTGNAKKAQIAEWERYFRFSRDGHKYIIEEIYAQPLKKTVKHGGARKIIQYIGNIEKLILDLLVQEKNSGQVVMAKSVLFRLLNMVNENYNKSIKYLPELCVFTKVEENDIQEFYESTSSMLNGNLVKALNNLKRKKVLFWQPVLMVKAIEVESERNMLNKIKTESLFVGYTEDGEEKYEYYTVGQEVRPTYREATYEEYKFIMLVESNVLKEMECNSESQVIYFGRWNEYKEKVNSILRNEANIEFSFEALRIILNEEKVKKEWYRLSTTKKQDEKETVNKKVAERILYLAKKRYERAKNYAGKETKENKLKTINRRSSNSYLANQKKLNDMLIDTKHRNILKELRMIEMGEFNIS